MPSLLHSMFTHQPSATRKYHPTKQTGKACRKNWRCRCHIWKSCWPCWAFRLSNVPAMKQTTFSAHSLRQWKNRETTAPFSAVTGIPYSSSPTMWLFDSSPIGKILITPYSGFGRNTAFIPSLWLIWRHLWAMPPIIFLGFPELAQKLRLRWFAVGALWKTSMTTFIN